MKSDKAPSFLPNQDPSLETVQLLPRLPVLPAVGPSVAAAGSSYLRKRRFWGWEASSHLARLP